MMHKAWSSIEEVPYCFSRSYIKLQGHTAKKNRFLPKLGISGQLELQFEFTNGYEMMHKAWSSTEEVRYCFSRSYVKFQGHTAKKNRWFWPKLGVSGLELQFEFPDGFEMMHKAWCSIEEVPYYFSAPSIKFQGRTGWKIDNLNPIWVRLLGRSQLSNPSDLPCLKWNRNFDIVKKLWLSTFCTSFFRVCRYYI